MGAADHLDVSSSPARSRFMGLNTEAKKKKKKNKPRRKIFQQCNSVCFVFTCAGIHSVSSFIDDDFTKTVFIIREDKEYLFTGSTVCVVVTHRKTGGGA